MGDQAEQVRGRRVHRRLDLAGVERPGIDAHLVERALDKARLSREAARLREQVGTRLSMKGILGDHPAMQRVLKTVEQVGKSRATVLVHVLAKRRP